MYLSQGQTIAKSMNGLLVINASEIIADNASITNLNDVSTINSVDGDNLTINAINSDLIIESNNVDVSGNLILDGDFSMADNSYLNRTGGLLYIGDVPYINSTYVWIWGSLRVYSLLVLNNGIFVNSNIIDNNEIATLDGIDITKTIQQQFNDLTTLVNNKLTKTGDTATGVINFDSGFTSKFTAHFLAGASNFVLLGCDTFVNGKFTLQSTGGIILGALSNLLISQTELSYLSGVTSSIQSQLNSKANLSGAMFTGLCIFTAGCNFTGGTPTFTVTPIFSNTSTFNGSPSFNAKLECNANVKLNGSSGLELTTPASTISQTELSYLFGVSSSIQTQLNGKLGNTGSQTIGTNGQLFINSNGSSNLPTLQLMDLNVFKGIKIICNTTILSPRPNPMIGDGEAVITTNSNNNSSIVISPANTALQMGIRLLTSSSSTGTITIRVGSNEIITNQTEHTINGSVTYSGPSILYLAGVTTTFSNGFTSNGTIINNNPTNLLDNLNMNSSTTTKNRILQPIITSGDVSGNQNNLKYSTMRYNSNSATGTAQPVLTLLDSFNNNSLLFLPNSGPGAYNPAVPVNSRAIIASGVQNSNTLSLSAWGSTRLSFKLQNVSSTSAYATMESGLNSITIHNSSGIDIIGVNQIRFGSAGTVINSDYGTTYTGTPITTILTTGADTNVSSALSVPAGIYNISWVICFEVITGSTTVSNYLACYSTSDVAYTDIASRGSFKGDVLPVSTLFTLQHSTTMTFTSSTNLYLRATCVFGTASRVQIKADLSLLRAVKIA